MTRQSPVYSTIRNLFVNCYLSTRLPKTDAWNEPSIDAVRDGYGHNI